MNTRLKEKYFELRDRARKENWGHYPAHRAIWGARNMIENENTRAEFETLENLGLVRIRIEPDLMADIEDLKGDCFNPDVNNNINPNKLAREEKEFEERVNQEGVYGIVGEYSCPHCKQWIHADSVWGFVGDDWKESGYLEDVMCETMSHVK